MLMLVLSDFHLGKGKFLEDGHINIMEDFDEDEKFAEFLEYYSTGTHYFSDVNIILNDNKLKEVSQRCHLNLCLGKNEIYSF